MNACKIIACVCVRVCEREREREKEREREQIRAHIDNKLAIFAINLGLLTVDC